MPRIRVFSTALNSAQPVTFQLQSCKQSIHSEYTLNDMEQVFDLRFAVYELASKRQNTPIHKQVHFSFIRVIASVWSIAFVCVHPVSVLCIWTSLLHSYCHRKCSVERILAALHPTRTRTRIHKTGTFGTNTNQRFQHRSFQFEVVKTLCVLVCSRIWQLQRERKKKKT